MTDIAASLASTFVESSGLVCIHIAPQSTVSKVLRPPATTVTIESVRARSEPGLRIWLQRKQADKRHYGAQGDARMLVVQADSKSLNPKLSQAVIDRAYEDDATAADAEFGGSFRQLSTAFLERSIVEKVVDKVEARLRVPEVQYLSFADPSGGTGRDSFTVSVGHKQLDQGREVAVLDALLEFRPPFDPDDVVRRIRFRTEVSALIILVLLFLLGWAEFGFILQGGYAQANLAQAGERERALSKIVWCD